MKNHHAPSAALLLAASLLASGHAAARPAGFGAAAQEADKTARPRESARRVIVISVDAGRRVFFGKEQVGTCDDVGPLKERVREAVERNRRAARDKADGKADEKADGKAARSAGRVFICASPDLKYRDVVKIVDAIKEAGGDPVGLDTDCAPPG